MAHLDYRLGDTREVLASLPHEPRFSVLLSDPPYVSWAYLQIMQQRGVLEFQRDAAWQIDTFEWVCQWWFPMRSRMQPDAHGWLFCHPHYLGFYVRLALLSEWGWSGLWHCPPDELLLHFGPPLLPTETAAVSAAVQGNTYGQGKPVDMLRSLLDLSPPGEVLDPFMGGGSSLQAASEEGRAALGVEILPDLYQNACARLDPLREALIASP